MWASHSGAPWEPTLGLLSFKNWANLCRSLCMIKPMPPAVEGQVLNHHQGGPLSFVVLYILFWGEPSWLAHGGKTLCTHCEPSWVHCRGERMKSLGYTLCDLCETTTAVCVCVCVSALALTVETSLLNNEDLLSSSIVFLGYCFW